MTRLRIDNATARHLWLDGHGLARAPTGPVDVAEIVRRLGFVQLDSIQIVSRAHHHILWSRNQNYREPMLDQAMSRDRALFEHFTHDASVLPMEFLPIWQRQFRRKREYLDGASWFKSLPSATERATIRDRIAAEGPLSTNDFDSRPRDKSHMWARPPHKLALDYMWYAGELATCHRVNFTKYYDLAERIFPKDLRSRDIPESEQIDRLCQIALDRLGFASVTELQRFWDAATRGEVQNWVGTASGLRMVEIQSRRGDWFPAYAPPDIEDRIAGLAAPGSRVRVLNPFDPAIRDRARLDRLFGFDYRVEMFVPAAKRIWGYYVFPLLEGTRFIGRIEIKADRKRGVLNVLNFWPEPGVRWMSARLDRLNGELTRFARLAGVSELTWAPDASQAAQDSMASGSPRSGGLAAGQ
ncbi:winged helix DNA-binding domain-containing protein [Paracoccus sp. Z330]|uniref:Winged helix DNA-binding domain-containing protein n=1 Tax=Paracoccus onchidii TaxID=3017813 RepID=A0ABT4ZD31_9RHOB|nr:crosslink repair DNA glycosylase YcaQ family protein [Paracoccus onchidii]MDB6177269.1 winged helix DNA-binding domain-containing protein [Paracoccus onchidii]